ncbi:5-hydroxytryptamine receptor-like [Mytilus californianus]|uniref:5-hydroxytryptamine receptor-like n=1 Tax=Mytilus californianus TaxID=6549 RepID=UPI0022467E75|nr:5-hydroxytryptamine receptor-like [Mytilus californianus]
MMNSYRMALNFTNKSEEYLKQGMAKHLMADVVVLSLYLIICVIGNSIVLAVYRFQMKGKSEERYFIPFLAVADMLTCSVCSINNIILNMIETTFTNSIVCRIVFYSFAVTSGVSIFLLLSIAIQRYLIICRRQKLSLKTRKIMVIVSVCLSVACSVPYAVNYGLNEHFIEGRFAGYRCGRLKHGVYISGLVYAIFFITLMVFTVLTLVFLYGRIGWVIFKHFNAQKFKQSNVSKESSTADKLPNDLATKNLPIKTQELKNIDISYTKSAVSLDCKNNASIEPTQSSDVFTENTVPECSSSAAVEPTQSSNVYTESTAPGCSSSAAQNEHSTQPKHISKPNRITKRKRRFKNKFSLMFVIITAVAVVCYIPVGMVVLLEGIFPDFWERMSETVAATVLLLYHTYIINSILNPILYTFMDAEFSRALKELFEKCKCSKKKSK